MGTQVMEPSLKVAATSRLSEWLWKRAKKEAIDRGCPVSDLVEEALKSYLGVGAEGRRTND